MKRRNADYSLLKACKAFEPASIELRNGTCGNIQSQFNGEFNLTTGKQDGSIFPECKSFYEAVDAPMLLSRLCAGFNGLQIDVGGQEHYKTTWFTVLKHKKSGRVVTFYDWKGAASIGSDAYKAEGTFAEDLKNLLLALTNARFPHPYDDCVVGEIA